MENRQSGVYKLYKLGKKQGTKLYDLELKQLERNNHVVTTAYAERINSKSEENGLYYELQIEATNEYFDNAGKGKEFAEFEDLTGGKQGSNGDAAEAEKAKLQAEAEKLELRQKYFDLTGKEANKNYGVAKLTELVDEAQKAKDAADGNPNADGKQE